MLLRLERFDLDTEALELRRGGECIELQRLPLDLLIYLVRNRERIVPRDELLSALWPDLHVSDGALSTAIYTVRQALEDSTHDEPWIRTVRGHGFRYEGPCRTTSEKSRSPEPAPLVGRGAALGRLADSVEEARGGRGAFVFVPAAAGMGKTRLIREFLSRLAGFRVVQGRAIPEPEGDPFALWHAILEQLENRDAEETIGSPPTTTREGSTATDLHERVQSAVVPRPGEDPLLLVLEDLHWAHPAALGVLSSLLSRIEQERTLIVSTFRPGTQDAAGNRLSGLSVQPGVVRLDLPPLDVDHVYSIVGALRERAASQDEVATILRRSEGVPLYVIQLAYEGMYARESKESAILSDGLTRLSDEAQSALGVAALIGTTFDLPLVEAAYETESGDDRSWVAESIRAGVVEQDTSHPLRLRFTHALYREAAARLLDFQKKIDVHGRVADLLESAHPEPSPDVIRSLARHYAASVSVPERLERAVFWDLAVARAAAERFAWEDVFESTSRLKDWLGRLPAESKMRSTALEIELLHSAALASLPGSLAAFEESLARAERLGAGAHRDDRVRLASLRLLCGHLAGNLTASEAGLAELRTLPGQDVTWLADTLEILPGVQAGALERTQRTAQRIISNPGPSTRNLFPTYDASDVCLAYSAIASSLLGDETQAILALELAEARAIHRGDALTQATVLFTGCVVHEIREDWERLRATAARIDPLCNTFDVRRFLGSGFTFETWAMAHLKPSEAPFAGIAGVVNGRAQRSEGTSFRPFLLGFAARMFERGENTGRALACFDEASACLRAGEIAFGPEILRQHAELLWKSGDREGARRRLDESLDVAGRIGAILSESRARNTLANWEGPSQNA